MPSTASSSRPKAKRTRTHDPVLAYARNVLAGRIIACRLVKLACERHIRDLAEARQRGLRWDLADALYAIRFFLYLRHSKGEWAGQPVELSPWQQFCVGSVFGWKMQGDAGAWVRRFRSIYQEVPRKNGKSTMLAGIGLLMLVGDAEPGAEVYTAATKKEQARIIFEEARRMVLASQPLRKRIKVNKLNLSVERTNSKFEPLSADEQTADGLNPSASLIDEFHKHRSRAMLDVLRTATGSRRQPLDWIITTSGDDPMSACGEEHDYAVRILERQVENDAYFVYIATVDKGDEWDDPRTWAKANPNLHVSVKLEDLQHLARQAKDSPASRNAFKRLRLDIWTQDVGRAIDLDVWAKNGIEPFTPDFLESLKGRDCALAIDLSSKLDITATVKLFPPVEEGNRWVIVPRFFMPAENLADKEKRDRQPYTRWVEEGWIEATSGNVIDHERVAETVREDGRLYNVLHIPYDPWNATQMASQFLNEGLPAVEFIQGLRSFTEPTKTFRAMLATGAFNHGFNPVLKWMASNLVVQTDKNENEMPAKKQSRGRIDGMVCIIMGVGVLITTEEKPYSDGRGLRTIG